MSEGSPILESSSFCRPCRHMAWSSRSLLHVRDGQRCLHQPAPFPTWSRGLPDLMEAPLAACALHCQRRVTRRRAVVEPSSNLRRASSAAYCQSFQLRPSASPRSAQLQPSSSPRSAPLRPSSSPRSALSRWCSSTRPSHGDLHGTCITTTRCHHLLGHSQHVIITSDDGIRGRRYLRADV
ncbi:hypothetical protein PVAP13_9NG219300 [Panicum virgatum]|uniref:Uncharacterized protein n=1 Tax=Panicum virgatum TaxID=38727 RepID=A0A8T0MI24_PANVG|nr:hypothetical protein PVAP13_9NG219300 [Panicum virgatum]